MMDILPLKGAGVGGLYPLEVIASSLAILSLGEGEAMWTHHLGTGRRGRAVPCEEGGETMETVQLGGGGRRRAVGAQLTSPLGVTQGLDVLEVMGTTDPASGVGGPSLMHPDVLEFQRLPVPGS